MVAIVALPMASTYWTPAVGHAMDTHCREGLRTVRTSVQVRTVAKQRAQQRTSVTDITTVMPLSAAMGRP